jgi:predicted small integral membrane protein
MPTDDGKHDHDGILARTTNPAFAVGFVAYVGGLGLTLALLSGGIPGVSGVWGRVEGDIPGQLLAHQAAHAPLWNATLHLEMVPVTALLVVLVGAAGFVLARRVGESRSREEGFQAGSRVFVGYLPATFLASVYMGFEGSSIEWLTLVAPTLLAGLVFPALVGGAGGVVAMRLEQRESRNSDG